MSRPRKPPPVEDPAAPLAKELTTDARFALVPEWVLSLPLSDKALRLYLVLSRYADNEGLQAFPGRKQLASRCFCSVDTIDRVTKELVAQQAVTVEPQYDAAGDRRSNLYTVKRELPEQLQIGGV